MTLARIIPTVALVGVMALVVSPVAVALFKMGPASSGTPAPAQSNASTKPTKLAGFDGERAYGYLLEQCKIGPRVSGTEGNQMLRRQLKEHFESLGAQVTLQAFVARHPMTGEPVEMENVMASWQPDRARRVVIGAHFDTRPHADREASAKRRAEPFLGANDGASGVAVLMELAHVLADLKPSVGVDLVAFDGEELVFDERGEYFLGSTHFAQDYLRRKASVTYVAGIVVDMVGDKSLDIRADAVSARESPQLVQEIWGIARRLRATGFKSGRGHDIRDDHLPLLDAGIPTIDIIDFDYGPGNQYWHTLEDKPERCSASSLAQVGGVLAEWLRGK